MSGKVNASVLASKSQHEIAQKVLEKLIFYINEEKSKDEGAEIYFKTLAE